MKFLFWNIEKKQVCFDVIVDLIKDATFDVIALAEIPQDDNDTLLPKLQSIDSNFSFLKPLIKEKVALYYNKSTAIVGNQFNEGKVAIKRITSKTGKVIANISFLHLDSKVNYSEMELSQRVDVIVQSVLRFEADPNMEHGILLLCGDFNMNPFEIGCIKANGFNAVMERKIAQKGSRTVQKMSYRYFYNPMWGFLGDLGKGEVSGTYYYDHSDHIQYYWNIFDQVLLRPEAIPYFDKDALQIITKSTNYNLLTKSGIIDKKQYSDHLPITFTLNI